MNCEPAGRERHFGDGNDPNPQDDEMIVIPHAKKDQSPSREQFKQVMTPTEKFSRG